MEGQVNGGFLRYHFGGLCLGGGGLIQVRGLFPKFYGILLLFTPFRRPILLISRTGYYFYFRGKMFEIIDDAFLCLNRLSSPLNDAFRFEKVKLAMYLLLFT